ncbi:MAG TPA: TA system VapC family ribonuclease toxin [Candidatus Limnocylindrales bacterium]|nr:TA system VapC family ribonuclease toxin [Candidatus Limnocylindrales bacterium]
MTRSSRLFLFPDINVWVALTYDGHIHHAPAREWFERLPASTRLFFSRFTQLGLLRLLTAAAVMGEDRAKSQREAWKAYDRWLQDDRIEFLEEPAGVEAYFRTLTRSHHASPKDWADSYLAAFCQASRLTLVTFDRAFGAKVKDATTLQP